MGGGPVGALRRRLCGAGALSGQSLDRVDRVETGRLAGVREQPGENASGEAEGRRSESGLSGIHIPLLRRPARAWVAVFAGGSVGQGPEQSHTVKRPKQKRGWRA